MNVDKSMPLIQKALVRVVYCKAGPEDVFMIMIDQDYQAFKYKGCAIPHTCWEDKLGWTIDCDDYFWMNYELIRVEDYRGKLTKVIDIIR